MSFDLQQINCYDSTNCKEISNCAPTSSPFTCNVSTNQSDLISCPTGQTQSYCYGNNSNFCSGIYQECDPNKGYFCQPQVSNPASNYFGDKLGCNIKTDPGCLEFESFSPCQDSCWDLGGSSEVHEMCKAQFKDSDSCNEMKYFCKWNDSNNSCDAIKRDPWLEFSEKGPQTAGNPSSVFTENLNSGHTLNCAQSSWSSTQMTSYADQIRTCCINAPGSKKCITTPRCQFVENTCECGFKDISSSGNPSYTSPNSPNPTNKQKPWFMCSDTTQALAVNSNSYVKSGYCTWCKGSQLKDFDYKEWLIKLGKLPGGTNIRTNISWGTPDMCNNRCSEYNKCEIDKSESAFNQCIWEKSNHALGVDPNNPESDLSKGFCYSNDCIKNAKTQQEIDMCNTYETLKNECETQLNLSTKNRLTILGINDNGPQSAPCTEGSTWQHSCVKNNNFTKASNFVCGWCENLQSQGPECSTSSPTNSPTNSPTSSQNWYSPFGVKDEQSGIALLLAIILFCVGILALIVYLIIKYKYKL
jgi:hypothetical protein